MKDDAFSTDKKSATDLNETKTSASETNPHPSSPLSGNTKNEIPFEITNLTQNGKNISTDLPQPTSDISKKKQTMDNGSHTDIENHTPTPKSRKHLKMIVASGIFIIIIPALAYGIITYIDWKAQKYQESLDLAVLCEENYNIEDYQAFLKKYPESQHSKDVNARMTKLEEMHTNWSLIKNSIESHDYIDFKNRYNDSHYNRLCNLKLDSIDWSAAQKSNTPDAYEAYINRNPNGLYVSEAIIAKGEVGYMSLTDREINNIYNTCTQLFSALGVNNAESINVLLSSEIESFLQMKAPTHEEILQWMSTNQSENRSKSYVIKDSIQSQRAFNAEKGISYISNINVELITTDDHGNETKSPLVATIKQNRKFQIYSFTIKNI